MFMITSRILSYTLALRATLALGSRSKGSRPRTFRAKEFLKGKYARASQNSEHRLFRFVYHLGEGLQLHAHQEAAGLDRIALPHQE